MLACSLQSLLWTSKKAQHRRNASCSLNSQSVGHIQQLDKPAVGQLRMRLYGTICLTGQWCYTGSLEAAPQQVHQVTGRTYEQHTADIKTAV